MKFKLNHKEEIIFWDFIKQDLIYKLKLSEESHNWSSNTVSLIDNDIRNFLTDSARYNLEIQKLCNLHEDFYSNYSSSLTSTIYKIFVSENYNTTSSFTKNRFTYFLAGISADDYIEARGVFKFERINKEKTKDVSDSQMNNFSNISKNNIISVFISYSWDSEQHKRWILTLANRLINNGVDVLLDQYELGLGSNLNHFMDDSIIKVDKVLLILTKSYKEKADNRTGGVGYEYSIINQEYYQNIKSNNNFIPILRQGNHNSAIPIFLKSFFYLDMRNDENFEMSYDELLRAIFNSPKITKPKLGKKPDFDSSTSKYFTLEVIDHDHKPIRNNVYIKVESGIIIRTYKNKHEIELSNPQLKEVRINIKSKGYESYFGTYKTTQLTDNLTVMLVRTMYRE